MLRTISAEGICARRGRSVRRLRKRGAARGSRACIAKVAKCRCMRGVTVKLPAVGFMQAVKPQSSTSFSTIFCLSYQPR